jgi:hypothetical protein
MLLHMYTRTGPLSKRMADGESHHFSLLEWEVIVKQGRRLE